MTGKKKNCTFEKERELVEAGRREGGKEIQKKERNSEREEKETQRERREREQFNAISSHREEGVAATI